MKFQDLPLRKKLSFIIFLSSGAAIFILATAMIIYEATTYKSRVLQDASNVSELYGLSVSAALNFNDPKAGRENLMTLISKPNIYHACLYRTDGTVLADYTTSTFNKPCPEHRILIRKEFMYSGNHLDYFSPVFYSNEFIGMLYLHYELSPFISRFFDYGVVLIVVFLTLILVSFLISIGLKKYVSDPVLNLAKTAHLISTRQEYYHRAEVWSNDEMGGLTHAFNQMLDTVERSISLRLQSESRFRRVSDSNMIGIMFSDLNGMITEANDYFLRMVGFTREELYAGKLRWTSLTPPEYESLDEAAVIELTSKGVVRAYEKEYIRKDGKRIPVLLGAALLEGSQTDSVAFFLDISDRKRAEKEEKEARLQAERALKLREEFITIAAHELRTPLTPLKLQNDALKMLIKKNINFPQAESLLKFIQISDNQINSLKHLVGELLEFNQIRRGSFVLQKEQVDLGQLVNHVLNHFQDKLIKDGIELRLNFQENIIGIWDKNRLAKVVNNLFSNAIKYGSGKPIEVSISSDVEKAKLIVRDFGMGISKIDQERIFNCFERASSVDHFGGFGLGLFIANEIVEAHNGHISVESQENVGSAFEVELPLS